MKQMTFREFVAIRSERNIRLIDVREVHEWVSVRAIGTELHPLSRIQAGEFPDKDEREVAIICRSGARSAAVAQVLEGLGWSEVTNISDGTLGAIAAGEENLERG